MAQGQGTGVCFTPADISDFAQKDTQRLIGTVAKTLAVNSVYMNVIRGGTFPAGVSDEVRTAVQMQAAPGDSLAIPTFICDTDICGTNGSQELTDSINFTVRLESKRGKGPRVCVKKGYAAFKSSYIAAEDSLKKLITQYVNADIRAQLYLRSASKFVANSAYDFDSLFTGGSETDLGVKFLPELPDSPMSFKALHKLATYLKEVLFAEMYDSGGKGQSHFRFIGGIDQINAFREEAGVKGDALAMTQGGFKWGEQTLTGYSFESAPAYKGVAFGMDHRPLRFNELDQNGLPVLLDPVVVVSDLVNNKAYARANPAWLAGLYEIGIFMADNSFERWVPERYVGEGSFKFAPQLHMGELEWHYIRDNDCNEFGDYGWHHYQLTRAYKPTRPQWIIGVAYKRCPSDLGLTPCVTDTAATYSGADSYATIGCVPASPVALV